MTYLKFYRKEKELFPKEHDLILTEKEALAISKKLSRHFKFTVAKVKFYGKINCGYSWFMLRRIKVCHKPSLLVFVHELVHLYEYQVHSNKRHNKHMLKSIAKFLKYCNKMNYWRVNKK